MPHHFAHVLEYFSVVPEPVEFGNGVTGNAPVRMI